MFEYLKGDILESNADCLVNTVNCEGFMGKGIAYQFKLRFPGNNKDYIAACKSGRLRIGTIHVFQEDNKYIINFPTKNKWRENSKIEYIHTGMIELKKILPELNIKSIAIPPLGCGNGGLHWTDVKPIIIEHLSPFINDYLIQIYEPNIYYKPKNISEPKKLTTAHLVLMQFKSKLTKFNKLRLQKAAYFLNFFSGENYFKFERHKLGPYSHSIDIVIKDIKEFQEYYKLDTQAAYKLVKTQLISDTVEKRLKDFSKSIDYTADFINSINSDNELELIASICCITQAPLDWDKQKIVKELHTWSEEKAKKFSITSIENAVDLLVEKRILQENLLGFYILSNSSDLEVKNKFGGE